MDTTAAEVLNKTSKQFVAKVRELAVRYNVNFFVVTDGASGYSNNGNPAVKNARDAHIRWEQENDLDPYYDWFKEETTLV